MPVLRMPTAERHEAIMRQAAAGKRNRSAKNADRSDEE